MILWDMRPGQKTYLPDLALICANCHRMLHLGKEHGSIGDQISSHEWHDRVPRVVREGGHASAYAESCTSYVQEEYTMNSRPSLISLFCGPGGLDQGFSDAGFVTRLAYDIDESCVATHRRNHPAAGALAADLSSLSAESLIHEWRRRTQTPPVGIIGGPPCQSFSVSNVHQRDDDPRHRLPEHYARLLAAVNKAFSLSFFVFENVPGLTTNRHVKRFTTFKQMFEAAGFRVFHESLDAQHFGLAQVRPRIFVVGINFRKHPDVVFEFPIGSTDGIRTVRDAIGSLPDPVFFSPGLRPEDIPYHPNHWTMVPRSSKFTNGSLTPGQALGRSFRVLAWDKPSYTVAYGHREIHVHPNCTRRLSIYEAMLLQGFPRDYIIEGTLSDQIRQVSDAVPPPVAKALADSLRQELGLTEHPSCEAAI